MLNGCGQNVYSLSTNRWITCVFVSTVGRYESTYPSTRVNKPQFLHTFTDMFYAQLLTCIYSANTSVRSLVFHFIHIAYNYKHQIKKGKK